MKTRQKQILNKPYLNPTSLRLLSGMMARYESFACHRFDGIIAATPFIRDKFLSINPNTVDVNNFPLLGELHAVIAWTDKRDEVCFIGGIDAIRGIDEVVRACALLKSPVRLNLAGSFFRTSAGSQGKKRIRAGAESTNWATWIVRACAACWVDP
ncbi:hypothetical protein ACFS07_02320 [Undibacterium arcticum]